MQSVTLTSGFSTNTNGFWSVRIYFFFFLFIYLFIFFYLFFFLNEEIGHPQWRKRNFIPTLLSHSIKNLWFLVLKTRGPAVICIGGERLVGLDSFVWSLVLAAAWIFGKSTNFPNFIWWKWHKIILDTIKYHSVTFYAFIQLLACGFSCFCHGKLIHIYCPVYACLRSDESLGAHSFINNWQWPFLYQRTGENGRRPECHGTWVANSWRCILGRRGSDRATA